MIILLLLHLLGTAAVIITVVATALRLPQNRQSYNFRIKQLAGVGLIQILSGMGLLFLDPNPNVPAFCIKGLLYLASLLGFTMFLRYKQAHLESHDNRA